MTANEGPVLDWVQAARYVLANIVCPPGCEFSVILKAGSLELVLHKYDALGKDVRWVITEEETYTRLAAETLVDILPRRWKHDNDT